MYISFYYIYPQIEIEKFPSRVLRLQKHLKSNKFEVKREKEPNKNKTQECNDIGWLSGLDLADS